MDPKDIVAKLRQIPLFETLTTAREELELYRIAKLVNFAEYDPGEWLFAQGQPASRLYLILRGRVRLTALDREGIIRHLGDKEPGDSFGETGLLVGDFHDATAEALSPTEVLYLERAPFLELLNERRRLRDWLNLTAALREQEKISRADWMRDDEWPLYKSNRHWIFLARRIFLPILLLFVVFLGPLLLALEPAILLTVWGLLGLPLLGFSLWHYIDWRDDRFTVTTQRVVHIERAGPFRESFEEASLNNIEDVYEARPNLTANLLDYGDVIPHTAGATVEIDLMGIPHPSRVRELILLQIQRNQARRVTLTRSTIREELESRLRLEPPPEPASPAKSTARPPSSAGIAAGLIKDFFFPASWSESEQGDTIKWRRFWLPGFIRYLWLFLPLVVIAMFGIWFF
ncbi:MAG: cyclic nucleotide-binding domain-containing protein, partial [Anaerolineae bacterium]|nr:cyclic nucleotide-binding domain-containing protein [Anaerolineae bacterium]